MKKIRDFQSFEFPMVEKQKFEEWQRTEETLRKYTIFIAVICILGNFILIPALGKAVVAPGILLIIPYFILLFRSIKKMKDAGITGEMIKKARKRP